MEAKLIVAGIDVHKKMPAVIVVDDERPQQAVDRRKFGSGAKELKHLCGWLSADGVNEVEMESTAHYWRPAWVAWKEHFVDALRLARRFLAAELRLSFVPDAVPRSWRSLTRANISSGGGVSSRRIRSKRCWKRTGLSYSAW